MSSDKDYVLPPCQVCGGVFERLSYVGRICDVFARQPGRLPLNGEFSQLPIPQANWAELSEGTVACKEDVRSCASPTEDTRACMIAEQGMFCYQKSGSSFVEQFQGVRWARTQYKPYPMRIGDFEPPKDGLPCPVMFPLCGNCTRLARNYASHWNMNHPYATRYGYEILLLGLQRRLVTLASLPGYKHAFYTDAGSQTASFLGNALVVQASPMTPPFKLYDAPEWSQAYPYIQMPSLPRWLLSKLRKVGDDDFGMKSVTRMDADAPAEHARTEELGPHKESSTVQSQVVGDLTQEKATCPRPDTTISQSVKHAEEHNHLRPLCSLPIELLQLITASLDRHSVFALREASSALASKIPLDQSFWYHELVCGVVPLFGFEPLNADAHTHIQNGSAGVFGCIDAFSEITSQFKPRRRPMFDPVTSKYLAAWPGRKDWRRYDWKRFVGNMAKVSEFLDGGQCEDAPISFRARRWLWGELDKIARVVDVNMR